MDLDADNESTLLHQQPATSNELDFNLADLSELPLEDFADIESLLSDAVDKASKFMPEENIIDLDDILEGTSGQSSPSTVDQQDYNALSDLMFDSDFMQGIATVSDTHVDVLESSNASCLSDSTNVIDSMMLTTDTFENVVMTKAGNKRTISSVTESETAVKQMKYENNNKEELVFICKENETEKDMIRRVKNNAASRVTRAKRKERHSELFVKQTELEKSNAELRIKIELMQKEADMLRQILVTKLSSTK